MRCAVILVILAIHLALSWAADLQTRFARMQHDVESLLEADAEAELDADISSVLESMTELRQTIASQQAMLDGPLTPTVAPPPPAPPLDYKAKPTDPADDSKPVTNYGNRETYAEKLKTNFTVYDTVTLSGVPVHDKKTLYKAMDSINQVDKKLSQLHGLSTDVEFKN